VLGTKRFVDERYQPTFVHILAITSLFKAAISQIDKLCHDVILIFGRKDTDFLGNMQENDEKSVILV